MRGDRFSYSDLLKVAMAVGICLMTVSSGAAYAGETGDGASGNQATVDRRDSERPPPSKGDLGQQVGGGLTGMLAGSIAGGLVGGLSAWAIDFALIGETMIGQPELVGTAVGVSAGMLVGPPTGVLLGGNASGGRGKVAPTYLGSLAGLLVGGSLWGVTAIGTRSPSLGFGLPVSVFGLISGGVIGYRLSAPEGPAADDASARLMPVLRPVGFGGDIAGGTAGIHIQF